MKDIHAQLQNSLRVHNINISAFFSAIIKSWAFFIFFGLIFKNSLLILNGSASSGVVKAFSVLMSYLGGSIMGGMVVSIFINLGLLFFRILAIDSLFFSEDDRRKIKKISQYWYLLFMTIVLSISWHYFMHFSKISPSEPSFFILLILPIYTLTDSLGYYSDSTYYWIVSIVFFNYLHIFKIFLNDVFGGDKLKIGAKNLIFFSFGLLIATALAFSLLYDINRYDWLIVDNKPIDSLGQSDIIYFSFVNLSNLGYGFITPIKSGMIICTLQNMIALFVTGVFLASSVNFIGSVVKDQSN